MKKVRKILSLLLAAVCLLVLTACKENESTEAINKMTPDTITNNSITKELIEYSPVTLTTVSMFGGTDANSGNYQKINEEFMEDYPYITIEDDSQSADQDWKTKIAADFAVGNEPDVIQYFTDANASDVLAANKFVTIEDIRKVYPGYGADTLDSALESAANPDGVQRAVPTTGYWEGLFCNKDLFDQNGLELPTDWEKMVKAIETFQSIGIVPIAVSLNNVPHYWVEFLMLSSAGPESYETVPSTAPEDWCRGLMMFKTLREMGAFPKDTDTIDNDFASELFKKKKAAMQLEGSWYAGGIPDQKNTVVIAFPTIPDGKANGAIVGGISSGFYITKKAWEDPDKRDAAIKFVMAHTSKEAVKIYWSGNGQAACDVTPLEAMTPLELSGLSLSDTATTMSAPTDSRISQEAYNTLINGIMDISTGIKDPEDLLNEVLTLNKR
jgi:raffinose/stachyose/melibiose transport system substrate-binding protein